MHHYTQMPPPNNPDSEGLLEDLRLHKHFPKLKCEYPTMSNDKANFRNNQLHINTKIIIML